MAATELVKYGISIFNFQVTLQPKPLCPIINTHSARPAISAKPMHHGLRKMIMARTPRSPMGHNWKKSSAHTKSEGAADASHAGKKRRPGQALLIR